MLLALGMFSGGGTPPRQRLPKRQRSTKPPTNYLGAGVYWYWLRWSTDKTRYEAWQRANAGSATVIKVLGAESSDAAVLIIEVYEPVQWTLPGMPTPAPRGINTTIEDIYGSAPPGSRLQRWLESMKQLAPDVLRYYDEKMQRWLDSILR